LADCGSVTPFGEFYSLASSGSTVYAGSSTYGVYKTTDDGSNWMNITKEEIPHAQVAALAATGSFVYAGLSSGVYRSSDLGGSWTQANSGLTSSVTSFAVNGRHLYAGTRTGVFTRITTAPIG